MSANEPTATAYKWKITSGDSTPQAYELACFANQIFSTEIGLRTVYRVPKGEWKFLIEPSIFNEDDFNSKTDAVLAQISKKVSSFFLLGDNAPPIPATIFEQAEALLRSGVEWNGIDTLSKK